MQKNTSVSNSASEYGMRVLDPIKLRVHSAVSVWKPFKSESREEVQFSRYGHQLAPTQHLYDLEILARMNPLFFPRDNYYNECINILIDDPQPLSKIGRHKRIKISIFYICE